MRIAVLALTVVVAAACSSTVEGGAPSTTPLPEEVDAGVCTRAADGACYTGPAATRDVGECKSGFHQCVEEACYEEVTPVPERCETAADEDCDGLAPPCPAALIAKRFGGAFEDALAEMSIDAAGGIVLTGTSGDVDFGGGVLKGSFVAKLGADATPLWSRGVAARRFVGRAAADGTTFIAGTTTSGVDIGGAVVTGAFLAKLSDSGAVLWAKSFGGQNDDDTRVDAIAVGADGSVAIGGLHRDAIDFGGGALADQGIFLARFDGAGTHLRSVNARSGIGILYPRARAVAVAADGSIAVTGACERQMDFGAGYKPPMGDLDGFVARWDATGTLVHGDVFGSGWNQTGTHLAFASSGSLLIAGVTDGSFTFGGRAVSADDWDHPFFVELSPSGDALRAGALAGDFDATLGAIAADGTSGWLAAGSFDATVAIGAGKMTANDTDAWIAKLDGGLSATAGLRIGGRPKSPGAVHARGAARLPDGRVVVAGSFDSTIDLGVAALESGGGTDLFVAVFPSF